MTAALLLQLQPPPRLHPKSMERFSHLHLAAALLADPGRGASQTAAAADAVATASGARWLPAALMLQAMQTMPPNSSSRLRLLLPCLPLRLRAATTAACGAA